MQKGADLIDGLFRGVSDSLPGIATTLGNVLSNINTFSKFICNNWWNYLLHSNWICTLVENAYKLPEAFPGSP